MPTRSVISELAVSAETPQRLSAAIAEALQSALPIDGLTLRPWDGGSSECALWWALPSRQWPAFHLPKLFVDWLHPHIRPDLLFGLHLEKGVEPSAQHASACDPAWIMDAHWAWQRLRRDLRSGAIDQLVRQVSSSDVPKLYLRMEIGDGIGTGTPNPCERTLWRDGIYYGFECNGEDAGLRPLFAHDPNRLAAPLGRSKTLQELAAAMDEIPDACTRWIDWQLGIAVRLWEPGSAQVAIAVPDLVGRYVAPFVRWMAAPLPCGAGSTDAE